MIHSLFDLDDYPELTFYGLFVLSHHRGRTIETPLVDVFEIDDKAQKNNSLKTIAFGSGIIGRN
ncbi:hypothetical protein C2W62_38880 [Candidatus Entotheonella serta]|nr:hypothetical protein C2W62_38880 [Candidatus Entotheonella serta]